jgi:hypothetical protein
MLKSARVCHDIICFYLRPKEIISLFKTCKTLANVFQHPFKCELASMRSTNLRRIKGTSEIKKFKKLIRHITESEAEERLKCNENRQKFYKKKSKLSISLKQPIHITFPPAIVNRMQITHRGRSKADIDIFLSFQLSTTPLSFLRFLADLDNPLDEDKYDGKFIYSYSRRLKQLRIRFSAPKQDRFSFYNNGANEDYDIFNGQCEIDKVTLYPSIVILEKMRKEEQISVIINGFAAATRNGRYKIDIGFLSVHQYVLKNNQKPVQPLHGTLGFL